MVSMWFLASRRTQCMIFGVLVGVFLRIEAHRARAQLAYDVEAWVDALDSPSNDKTDRTLITHDKLLIKGTDCIN
jgi:hypothetical protein